MYKNYIISQYKRAMSDYKLAMTEDAKNGALVTMHRLTSLAAQLYGFEFADSLVYLSDKWLEECVNTERVV